MKYLIFAFGIAISLILFCTEKIPQGPERTEILEVKLFIYNDRIDFAQENNWENRFKIPPRNMSMAEYEMLSQWRVPFGIMAYNNFDEAIDGRKWIVIKVNLWPNNSAESWQAQLVFADTTATRHLTIPPGDSLSIYTGNRLTWEQKDDKGLSIHHTDSYTPIWIDCTLFDSLFKNTRKIVLWRDCDTLQLAPVDTVAAYDKPKIIYAQAEVQLFQNYRVIKSNTVEFKIHYFFPSEGFRPKFWCPEGDVLDGDPPCPFGAL